MPARLCRASRRDRRTRGGCSGMLDAADGPPARRARTLRGAAWGGGGRGRGRRAARRAAPAWRRRRERGSGNVWRQISGPLGLLRPSAGTWTTRCGRSSPSRRTTGRPGGARAAPPGVGGRGGAFGPGRRGREGDMGGVGGSDVVVMEWRHSPRPPRAAAAAGRAPPGSPGPGPAPPCASSPCSSPATAPTSCAPARAAPPPSPGALRASVRPSPPPVYLRAPARPPLTPAPSCSPSPSSERPERDGQAAVAVGARARPGGWGRPARCRREASEGEAAAPRPAARAPRSAAGAHLPPAEGRRSRNQTKVLSFRKPKNTRTR